MRKTSNPKIILITGTSSGFGLRMAARFASQGHQVIATMRNLEKQGALLDEVKRRGGGLVEVMPLDVTDSQSIKDLATTIGARFGYVDVLINNAGYGIGGFFEDLTEEEIREQMETNFFGVQNLTRQIIPFMRQRRQGKIINLSSVAGFSTSPCFSAYNTSKWALEAFSESLRYELKQFGIDVHVIEPGTYRTKIFYENARYAQNFDNPNSPYYNLSQNLKKRVMDFVDDCHKDPEEIAIVAEKLIKAKHAPFRNIPDIESQILFTLRKFLPFRAYSFMIEKALLSGVKTRLK